MWAPGRARITRSAHSPLMVNFHAVHAEHGFAMTDGMGSDPMACLAKRVMSRLEGLTPWLTPRLWAACTRARYHALQRAARSARSSASTSSLSMRARAACAGEMPATAPASGLRAASISASAMTSWLQVNRARSTR